MPASAKPAAERNRICLIGYMAGARPGFTTSQGLVLAKLLESEGWQATTVSTFHNRWCRLLDILWVLLRDGRRFSAAVLEVYGGRGFFLADITSFFARTRGLPLIMVLHGGSIPDIVRTRPGWASRVLSRAAALVAPSRFQARSVQTLPGISARIIPNTVHIELYPFVPRERVRPRMLWMRNFHELYNPLMALRVLKRLSERYPDAELIMAGRDDENCELVRQAAAREGLTDRVSFPGFLDLPGKLAAASHSDVFLNTNKVDNMPVAVVEACALGLPVVATSVGGVPDLLTPDENGLLVPSDDDRAMAAAIARLIETPGLAHRLSINGRKLAEESGSARVVPLWTQLLRETIARNAS